MIFNQTVVNFSSNLFYLKIYKSNEQNKTKWRRQKKKERKKKHFRFEYNQI